MKLILLGILAVAVAAAACGEAPADSLLTWDNSQKGGEVTDSGASGATTSSTSGSGSGSGSGSSSGSGTTSGGSGTVSGATGVPCDVATVYAEKCTGCHSDPPVNGSLSGLVTLTDLTATAKEDTTKTEIELSVVRMQSTTSPMPPASVGNPATAADIATLQNWITAGTPAGSCDAGAVGGTSSNVFTGQPAFATKAGPDGNHNAGRDCLSCHDGSGEAPQFIFAGTLYDGSGNAVSGAEIRVVDAAGKADSVYSASDGNFYERGSTAFAAPGHAGARDATTTNLMVSQVTNGGCNSCHCTGSTCTTAPLHVP
jgi:hypothetical protein